MKLSEELEWRGFIKDKTFSETTWLDTPRAFYLGSDASADSLQIGNLAIYMLARQLAAHGWKAVMLVGGATSLIGDPGGKEEERQLKPQEEVEKNIAAVAAQVKHIFGDYDFTPVNNYDWFKGMGYLEFLRDVGKHYSMTELVQREFITARMGEGGAGISYAEFSYSLIQGYDYYRLFKDHGVELQIGGSDQWGNMLSGAPLIRKKEGKEVHALSMPLVINKATGKKFGKSEDGAVWLDPAKTSPTQFYQFWINCGDEGIEDHLKIYTTIQKEELDALMTKHRESPKERSAQKVLAQKVTTLVHGHQEMKLAEEVTEYLIGQKSIAEADNALEVIRKEIPAVRASVGADVADILVEAGLATSKTEARRFIAENAVAINGEKTQKEQLEESDFQNGRLLIRRGKAFKDSALVELV
jgi:tyrosyl-tRNA synthetase